VVNQSDIIVFTVIYSLNTGIVSSNPARGLDDVQQYVLLCVDTGVAVGPSLFQRVLPDVIERFIVSKLIQKLNKTDAVSSKS
jgi:hypothetical protein